MSYKTSEERQDPTAAALENELLPCTVCSKPTRRIALSNYGARCFACYEAYCAEPRPPAPYDRRQDGPKAWAYALKAKEEAGERLGFAQRQMWRAALKEGDEK